MPKLRTITPEKIDKVKTLLKKHSIRGAAFYSKVSKTTVVCISRGMYDSDIPLREFKKCN